MADPSAAMPPLMVVTRALGANEALAARLQAHGWEACVLPALEILPLDCLEGLPMPEDYDMVVFVSGNAARLYLDQLTRARGGFPGPGRDRRHCRPGQRAKPARTARLWREYNSPASAGRRAQPRFEALWAVLQDCPRCPRAPCWCAARRAATGWATPWPRTVCGWRDTPPTTGSPRSGRRNRWRRSSAGPKPGFPPPGSSPAGEGADAALANLRAAGLQAWWEGCGFVLTHPSPSQARRPPWS